MLNFAFAILPVFLLLIFSEYLWRTNRLRGESARKLIHIIVGSYVAFWPFFISFEAIQVISAAFLLVIGISLRFRMFKAIHGVARQTWGEVLFAIGIGLIAVLTKNPWIFAACILHMSVADGFAALAGMKWGKSNKYKVLDHTKSIIGTTVFWFCSLLITSIVIIAVPDLSWSAPILLAFLPLATALTENVGIGGTDNILVPMLVFLVLSS